MAYAPHLGRVDPARLVDCVFPLPVAARLGRVAARQSELVAELSPLQHLHKRPIAQPLSVDSQQLVAHPQHAVVGRLPARHEATHAVG